MTYYKGLQNVIITGDPEGLPPLSPLPPKDPVKDKMQKLAGIKPEKNNMYNKQKNKTL